MNPAFELTKAAIDSSVARLADPIAGFNAVCGAMATERELTAPVIDFDNPGENFYLAYASFDNYVRYAPVRKFPAMVLWVSRVSNQQRGNQQHTFHGTVGMTLAIFLTDPSSTLPPDLESGLSSLMVDAAIQTIGDRLGNGFGGYGCVVYNGVIGADRPPVGFKEGEGLAQVWFCTYELNITAD